MFLNPFRFQYYETLTLFLKNVLESDLFWDLLKTSNTSGFIVIVFIV